MKNKKFRIALRRCLAVAVVGASLVTGASEPVSSCGRVPVVSVNRTWKIVYGTTEGPEGRALELLSGELGSIYVRDPGVYTLHVLPCVRAGAGAASEFPDAFVIGTRASNPELAKLVGPDEIPSDGYLVKTLSTDAGRRVVIAGQTPAAVVWAVADFLDDGLNALAVEEWDGIRYRSSIFRQDRLGRYESRRAPKTRVRSVFTWGHVIDDYRAYFRNLARLRFNEVIVWNNHPPVNAREVAAYARSWGLSVIWGFAWGWTTDCSKVDFARLDRLEDAIVREWREVWRPLGGDGIYFQTFTELDAEAIDGHPVAESAVGLVNRVVARIRRESPRERIVFGLHAKSENVRKNLSVIDGTDPSVEILWEDCGGFPFNWGRPFDPKAHNALVDEILGEDRSVGLVLKGMVNQDWKRFAYPAGPYVLGCASSETKAEDARIAEELWRPFLADWEARGRAAYDVVRRVQAARPGRSASLCAALNANGDVRYPLALVAEMFWSADEPYETIARRVRARPCVR